MDKKSLDEKKASIEQAFNALSAKNKELSDQNETNNKQINNNNEELLKLAGEFRLVEQLLSNPDTKAKEEKNG